MPFKMLKVCPHSLQDLLLLNLQKRFLFAHDMSGASTDCHALVAGVLRPADACTVQGRLAMSEPFAQLMTITGKIANDVDRDGLDRASLSRFVTLANDCLTEGRGKDEDGEHSHASEQGGKRILRFLDRVQ